MGGNLVTARRVNLKVDVVSIHASHTGGDSLDLKGVPTAFQ